MKIRVDAQLCNGQARCNATAPTVFRLDDDGYNASDDDELADDQLLDASRGVLACPEGAITLLDADGTAVAEEALRRLAGLDS